MGSAQTSKQRAATSALGQTFFGPIRPSYSPPCPWAAWHENPIHMKGSHGRLAFCGSTSLSASWRNQQQNMAWALNTRCVKDSIQSCMIGRILAAICHSCTRTSVTTRSYTSASSAVISDRGTRQFVATPFEMIARGGPRARCRSRENMKRLTLV